MKNKQISFQNSNYRIEIENLAEVMDIAPQLVLCFGSQLYFESKTLGTTIKEAFPRSLVIGCSSAGEISNQGAQDNQFVVTGLHFDKNPKFRPAWSISGNIEDSFACGVRLSEQLKAPDLKMVFVLGLGIDINGSQLIAGIQETLGKSIPVTGGLAGDGGEFKKTYTLINGNISPNKVVAFGGYGENFKFGISATGGFKNYGPVRKATKSRGNVIFQLDGEPALEVYRKYLGDKARELPGVGLSYPFAILNNSAGSSGIIRTVLAVNEKEGSLAFAGDIPADCLLRIMHADTNDLVGGARRAAENIRETVRAGDPNGVAILISCIGRKLLMGPETAAEIRAIQELWGLKKTLATSGFYAYGQICPIDGAKNSFHHNQTMTITYLTE